MKEVSDLEGKHVSVCLITYNHASFIRRAIDGVLNQKISFSFELIIADDYSTDGTREILLEYKNRYPNVIHLLLQNRNVGPSQNWLDLITTPKSKYIAYFEGDDYWIDSSKLQVQFDALENNEGFSLCTHNAITFVDGKKNLDYVNAGVRPVNTFNDVLMCNSFPSSSLFYRNNLLTSRDYRLLREALVGDWPLQLLLLRYGKMCYINNCYSVYNIHSGSSWAVSKQLVKINNIIVIYHFFISNMLINSEEIEIARNCIAGNYRAILSWKIDAGESLFFRDILNVFKYSKIYQLNDLMLLVKSLVPSRLKRKFKYNMSFLVSK